MSLFVRSSSWRPVFFSACGDRNLSKLSYFHAPGKEPLLPWTVGEVIDRAADSTGDTAAIVSTHQNISKTYTQYRRDVSVYSQYLFILKFIPDIQMISAESLTMKQNRPTLVFNHLFILLANSHGPITVVQGYHISNSTMTGTIACSTMLCSIV